MFLVSEAHLFTDSNGPITSVMTNAKLVAASEDRCLRLEMPEGLPA